MELWRDIPGHAGYQASSLGRVRSVNRTKLCANGQVRHYKGHVLRPAPQTTGHLQVVLGRGRNTNVHRLVALAFHGEPPFPKAEVLHGPDPDPANNTPSNLRWGTRSENLKDDYARGVRARSPFLIKKSGDGRRITDTQIGALKATTCRQEAVALARNFGFSDTYGNNIRLGHASVC